MNAVLRRAVVALVLVAPTACASPQASTTAPRTTSPVAFGVGYTWGQMSDPVAGVRVLVHRPFKEPRVTMAREPRATTARLSSPGWREAAGELVVKVEVFNESRGDVRLGVAGYVGKYEVVPRIEEQQPSFPPGTSGAVYRRVLMPAESGPGVVHVAATVDRRPLADGWRYIGPVST